jgi:hypothetical protein
MSKLLTWGLLATLPLLAALCQGPPPEPEPEAPQKNPLTAKPNPAPLCLDSVPLPAEVLMETRNELFCYPEPGGWPNATNGDGPLGLPINSVINTQEEYVKTIRCTGHTSSLAEIDFTKHTLLAGKMWTPHLGFPRSVKFSQACGEYRLNVNLWPAGSGSMHSLSSYFVLVPKLPVGAKVRFNIYSKPCRTGDCP